MDNGSDQALKSFIERIERLEEEKAVITNDIKEVYSEAKSSGFDPKIMRMIVRERKQDQAKLQELESLLEVYRNALGPFQDTALGEAAIRAAM